MGPPDLLRAARELVRGSDRATAGLWPRAAAFLTRQALEDALDSFWVRVAPGVEESSTRAQLLCLPEYLEDDAVARDAGLTWAALSHACHHHPYDLPPTASELGRWMAQVEMFLDQISLAPQR